MGMYDTYGEHYEQLKVGECVLNHFNVGDKVYLPNGIYCGYDRAIVVNGNIFVADMPLTQIFNKWGTRIEFNIDSANPIKQALDEMEKTYENPTDRHDEGTSTKS